MSNGTNWFELANTYPLQPFLEGAYALEFRGTKCLCPFHADRHPTLSINARKSPHYFHCFACGAGGDIVKFVEKMDGVDPSAAAKKVLEWHGVEVGRELSDEEKEAAEAAQKKRIALIQGEAKKKEKSEAKKRAKVIKEMTAAAPALAENLFTAFEQDNTQIVDEIISRFPNIYNNSDIRDAYLGWCYENESVVIINRDLDTGKTFNIKYYREKGKDGKWISRYLSTTSVFGLDFIKEDGPVFVCEGEKDVINLLLLGVNAVTLGGVSNSWDKESHDGGKYYDVLKDRDVIIWYDNDKAGYINAMLQHKIIGEVAATCRVVMFNYLGNYSSKYDVSDYLAEKKFPTTQQLFDAIAYSTFVVTNSLIDEVIESLECTKSEVERLNTIKSDEIIKSFYDCAGNILSLVQDVKGERQEEVKLMRHLSSQLKTSRVKESLQKAINTLFPEDSEFLHSEISAIEKIIHFKKTLFTEYTQTHIRDIVMELLRATKSAGYEFATHRGILYLWTGNYYYGMQKWEIESFVMQNFFYAAKVDFKKHTVKTRNEVVENLYGWATPLERYVDSEIRVVNLLNGVLRVRANGKITFRNHHKKQDCAMNLLEFNYDKEANCPKWNKFLKRVIPDKDDRDTIEEFIGYCFLPSHKFEAFLLLYGASGANGKSVILEVMRSFFSRENVSSLELHNFDGHELDSLRNKIINIGAEIEGGADLRKSIASLKALTSHRDTINVNPKHKDPYVLYPEEKPKCAFASNKKFKSGADDGGVMRRAVIISFDEEIRDDEKIRDLIERFEDEKSGILNNALRGLRRLIKNGKFTMSEKRAEFMDEYKKEVNPVRAYIIDNLREDKSVCVPKKVVYLHYKEWADEMGYNIYSESVFWQKFKEQFKIKEKRPNTGKFESDYLSSRSTFLDGWCISGEIIPNVDVGGKKIAVITEKYSSVNYKRVSAQSFEVVYEN